MKNMSIRTKILLGVVLINLVGMMTFMIYLHQAYSGELDVAGVGTLSVGRSTWDQLTALGGDEFGPLTQAAAAQKYVDSAKAITGAEGGLMLDKGAFDQAAYAKAREAAGQPNDWDEREDYVLVASTGDKAAEAMQLTATADTVPEIGESVGVVYVIKDISASANAARTSQVRTMLVIVFGLVISTGAIALMLNALIFKRLNRMVASMEDISVRVAGGDFDAHFEPDGTNDEIGSFEQFFARFLDLASGTLKSLVK